MLVVLQRWWHAATANEPRGDHFIHDGQSPRGDSRSISVVFCKATGTGAEEIVVGKDDACDAHFLEQGDLLEISVDDGGSLGIPNHCGLAGFVCVFDVTD